MINAIMQTNKTYSLLEDYGKELIAIKDEMHDLRDETTHIQNELDYRTSVLEIKVNNLRPARDAKTENPKQKGDLEISSQIEANPFLPDSIDFDFDKYMQ